MLLFPLCSMLLPLGLRIVGVPLVGEEGISVHKCCVTPFPTLPLAAFARCVPSAVLLGKFLSHHLFNTCLAVPKFSSPNPNRGTGCAKCRWKYGTRIM